jgi:hypothetical protein
MFRESAVSEQFHNSISGYSFRKCGVPVFDSDAVIILASDMLVFLNVYRARPVPWKSHRTRLCNAYCSQLLLSLLQAKDTRQTSVILRFRTVKTWTNFIRFFQWNGCSVSFCFRTQYYLHHTGERTRESFLSYSCLISFWSIWIHD